MNEKTQELVNQAGQKVLDWIEATESFTTEQAPLLAQEIVRYGILNNSLQLGFFILVPSLLLYLSYSFAVHKDTWKDEFTPRSVACIIFGVGGFFVGVVGALECSINAVPKLCNALVAPRLYFIEQIGRLL